MDRIDSQQFKNTIWYTNRIEKLFDSVVQEVAALALPGSFLSPEEFSFSKLPATAAKANAIFKKLAAQLVQEINSQTEQSWYRGEKKQIALLNKLAKATGMPASRLSQLRGSNVAALKAFQARKQGDFTLSSRVWDITTSFQKEVETALDLTISEGADAANIARKTKHLLKNPDALYRRVRDKEGNLKLSAAAKQYHPGTGVYRSAYKNAFRLARTENNIAYHAASHEKYQEFDFVVGIQVRLSNNPLHCPFCEAMAGDYPKDFKFTGWHPQCRCTTVPILKTMEEMQADNDLIAGGDAPAGKSKNTVAKPPANFTAWMDKNRERLLSTEKLPYFVQDNRRYLLKQKPTKTAEHRAEIQKKWDARRATHQNILQQYRATLKDAAEFPLDISVTDLQKLHKDYRLFDLHTAVTGKQLEIAHLNALKTQLSAEIPGGAEFIKTFGVNEVEKAFAAANSKIAQFAQLGIDDEIKKLAFEIEWVEKNKKYATWQVGQAVYQRRYEAQVVHKGITEAEALFNKVSQQTAGWKASKITKAHEEIVSKLEQLKLLPNAYDLDLLQAQVAKYDVLAKEHEAYLLRRRAQTAAKKNPGAAPAGDDVWELEKYFTPAERAELARLRQKIIDIETSNPNESMFALKDLYREEANFRKQLSRKYYQHQTRARKLNGETVAEAEAALEKYIKMGYSTESMTVCGGDFSKHTTLTASERDMIKEAAKFTGMTEQEIGLVMRYSYGSGFVNHYYYGRIDSYTGKLNDYGGRSQLFKTALNNVVERLPKYNGTVFSGLKNIDMQNYVAKMQQCMKTGAPFENPAFLSTSTNFDVADSFDGQGFLIIKSKAGGMMHDITHYLNEDEVLMRAGSKYRVLKVYQNTEGRYGHNKSRWIFELEEIV